MKYGKGGWLYPGKFSNEIHDITDDDIDDLILCAEEEDQWIERLREQVNGFNLHPHGSGMELVIYQYLMTNTKGTVVDYPYGRILTFNSSRHFFRGERQLYDESIPTLNRELQGKSPEEQELIRVIADMRIHQFSKFIWKLHIVPYWEAKLCDVNYKALAQHYGFAAHLLDLPNDFRIALFFATCKYDENTGGFAPLTNKDIEESEDGEKAKFGMIYHSLNWVFDFLVGDASRKWFTQHMNDRRKQLYRIDPGDVEESLLDGINEKYDSIDLSELVGGMIYQTSMQKRYCEKRCIDIYGKLI